MNKQSTIQTYGLTAIIRNFSNLKYIKLPAQNQAKHQQTVIWLPGLGYSMEKFRKALRKSTRNFEFLQQTEVYILDPPQYKMTFKMFQNKIMHSWYDIIQGGPGLETIHNTEHIKENTQKISELIQSIYEKNSQKQYYIAGFSQGCAMAIHLAIFGMSGYMFDWTQIGPILPKIYLYHGRDDNVIEETKARKSYQRLPVQQYKVIEKVKHAISPLAIKEVNQFMLELTKQ